MITSLIFPLYSGFVSLYSLTRLIFRPYLTWEWSAVKNGVIFQNGSEINKIGSHQPYLYSQISGVSGVCVCRYMSLWFCLRSASPLSNTVFSSSGAVLPSTLKENYRISTIWTQIHISSLCNLIIYPFMVWYYPDSAFIARLLKV